MLPLLLLILWGMDEISSSVNSGNISLTGGENLTKIYVSNNSFVNKKYLSLTDCTGVKIDDLTKEKRVTEKGILNLISNLQINYSKIKNELGIPNMDDIEIGFNYPNGTIIEGGSKQTTKSNIYAKTVQVNYLSLDGKEEVGGVILKTW